MELLRESATACLWLFAIFFWLLLGDVNCVKSLGDHVQTGQALTGVHNDNEEYKRWNEQHMVRIPAGGKKSGSIYSEDHPTDSKSSQIQSDYPYSDSPDRDSPKNNLNSGLNLASVSRGQSNMVDNLSDSKAFAFPGDKKIHQAKIGSVLARFLPARMKSRGGFAPVKVKAPGGFGPNRRFPIFSDNSSNIQATSSALQLKSQKIPIFPKSFINVQHVLNPIEETVPPVKGNPPGSNSAGTDAQLFSPKLSPRVYSNDMSEGKGYTHVRRFKPDKKQSQASSTGRKYLEIVSPIMKHHQGKPACPSSSESRQNLNYNSRNKPKVHVPIQGKYKPFQTRHKIDAPTYSTDSEVKPTDQMTLPPSLNSTGFSSSAVPTVTGEWSTKSALPTQTEGPNTQPVTSSVRP